MTEHESASRFNLYKWTIEAVQSKRIRYALMALAGLGFALAGLFAVLPTVMTPHEPAPASAPTETRTAVRPLSSIDRDTAPFAEAPNTSNEANQPFRPAPGGTPPVPIDTLAGVRSGKLPAKAPALPGAGPKLSTKPDQEKVRAVILDASTPKGEKSTISGAEPKPRATNAPSLPSVPASSAAATPAAGGTKGDATRPVSPAVKITIVDIAEDGSYVLVTDPETRLPRKYTAGQKLFTGEQILKIEPDKSRIQLPSRFVAIQ